MTIAVPTWNGRVSPVFDAAQHLLVVEGNGAKEQSRREVLLVGAAWPQRVAEVSAQGVNVLICGAISQVLASMLADAGIRVVPFVSGEVEQVLTAYRSGRLAEPRFIMPGCRRRHRGPRGRGRGRRSPWP